MIVLGFLGAVLLAAAVHIARVMDRFGWHDGEDWP